MSPSRGSKGLPSKSAVASGNGRSSRRMSTGPSRNFSSRKVVLVDSSGVPRAVFSRFSSKRPHGRDLDGWLPSPESAAPASAGHASAAAQAQHNKSAADIAVSSHERTLIFLSRAGDETVGNLGQGLRSGHAASACAAQKLDATVWLQSRKIRQILAQQYQLIAFA